MADAPADGTSPHVWAAEHGDINLITALPRATGPGLQVWVGGPIGAGWRGVDRRRPPDDHVVLNTGMMLERLTNGVLPAGSAPRGRGARPDRRPLSVVQFLTRRPRRSSRRSPSCIDEGRPQRWAPIEAGAWLDQVLWDINLIDRS